MQKLKQFTLFETEKFLKDKTLVFMSGKKANPSHGFIGMNIEVMILEDKTNYGDGIVGANEFEKFTVKVPKVNETYLSKFKRMQKVNIVEIEKASLWGEYQTNLTITGKLVPVNG